MISTDFNIDPGLSFPDQPNEGSFTECVGIAVCDMATDLDGIVYDPDFSYAMTFRLLDQPPSINGTDPWTGMQAAVAYGLLPIGQDAFTAATVGELYVADWKNYPQSQLDLALTHARNGAISVALDFDAVVNQIRTTKQGVGLAMQWYASFLNPDERGRLPRPEGWVNSHMLVAKGVVTIDGQERLIIKPWLGRGYGQNGFASMSREQFQQCVEGAFAFNNNASRWISLIGIAVTKLPYLKEYVSLLMNPAPKNLLREFCLAIRDYEGKPGDRNYRNNNPGNCRFSTVGYLPMYGKVGKDKNGFAVFKDYDTGFLYLENLIRYRVHQHPDQTILELMKVYAPSTDNNNPDAYAKYLASRLGVGVDYKIKFLLS